MKAEKLPSGKWRCRAYNRYTGERPSFTADTKKDAERQAALYQYGLKKNENVLTFGDAYDLYALAHPNWSPRTKAEYERWKDMYYSEFLGLPLNDLTDERLQIWCDKQLMTIKAKTVLNRFTPIKAVLKHYRPQKAVLVSVGKVAKPKLNLPSQDDVVRLMQVTKGTQFYVPIYLAALCCMRRGEICALRPDHIDFKKKEIFIEYNLVMGRTGEWHIKSPKNGEVRKIIVPQIVMDQIKKYGLPNITNPNAFTTAWCKFLKVNKLPQINFHSLRHFCAAKMLSSNPPIPISVVQEYGGWKNKKVLMEIYDYVIDEIRERSIETWEKEAINFTSHILPTDS